MCSKSAQGFGYHMFPVYMSYGEEWQRNRGHRKKYNSFQWKLSRMAEVRKPCTPVCLCFDITTVLSTVTLRLVMKYVTCHYTCTNIVLRGPVKLG